MIYKYTANNTEHYATNLRYDTSSRHLVWDEARGQDVLIVQTLFGKSAVEIIDEICRSLGNIEISYNTYIEVLPNVQVIFVTATDRVKNKGCRYNGAASTYTVFGCCNDNDVCYIYEPQNQAMITSYCDIPLDMHVDISEHTIRKGFFIKKEMSTGYYIVNFPKDLNYRYIEGNLYFKIKDFKIPVTRQMLERTFYIKSDVRPNIISENRGVRLI